jgi:hypothetical protein
MAWIFCYLGGAPLCLLLEPDMGPGRRSRQIGRIASSWLITVDETLLSEFVLTELYVHMNGWITRRGEIETVPQSLAASSGSCRRVRLDTSETDAIQVLVVHAGPTKTWNLGDFIFVGEPKVIGFAIFEMFQDGHSNLRNKVNPR